MTSEFDVGCVFFFCIQDYSVQPPAQELVARDLHDNVWRFRHIFRGMFTCIHLWNETLVLSDLILILFVIFWLCVKPIPENLLPTRTTKTSLAYYWMESIYQWKKAFSWRLCFVCKVRVIMLICYPLGVGVCGLQSFLTLCWRTVIKLYHLGSAFLS